MRIALLADIHGNHHALQACLEDADQQEVEEILCLGDLVGYGAEPSACLSTLKERARFILMGNHEAGVTGRLDLTRFNPVAKEAILWTIRTLSQAERDFLVDLPLEAKMDSALCVHASPRDPDSWEYLLHPRDAALAFATENFRLAFVGHTHRPMIFVQENQNDVMAQSAQATTLDLDRRYIVNIGSVGQPRDNDPRSCYVIWDKATGEILFRRIEYDIRQAQEAILAAELPAQLAHRLAWGV